MTVSMANSSSAIGVFSWLCPDFVLRKEKSAKLRNAQRGESFQGVVRGAQESAVSPNNENGKSSSQIE
jgi:hypothetical protein